MVSISKDRVVKAIETLKNSSKKRRFIQSYELIIALKGLDMKKQENRKRGIIFLPKGRGKDAKVAIILPKKFDQYVTKADTKLYEEDLPNLTKREAKKFAKRHDFILAYVDSVPKIARFLGRYLGPRGKMPDPKYGMIIREISKADEIIEKFKKQATRFNLKDNPSVSLLVGAENMNNEDVAENVLYAYERIVDILPEKEKNVKELFLKLTMSKAVKI